MINKDRIVPVVKTDLISLYSVILAAASVTLTKADGNAEGEFKITAAPGSGSIIASEPVKSLDFGSDVSAATVYFVPALGYEGFSVNGTAVATTGADVVEDNGLYLATLATGAVSIAKVGL